MLEKDRHGSLTRSDLLGPFGRRRRLRTTALAVSVASVALGTCTAAALASGSAQGPPPGPKSPPFYQCPPVGHDSACEYLIDVTSTNPSEPPKVIRDTKQHFYDGSDDATLGVQNDTTVPLEYIHVGVAESKESEFAFDGDGLCSPKISPRPPSGCPFGPSLEDPFDYYGPDTVIARESSEEGTVFFPTPLQPGQYTYFALEAAPKSQNIVVGEVNDVVATTLTNTQTQEKGTSLASSTPVPVTDQAFIKGVNQSKATGKVEYFLYEDENCEKLVEKLGSGKVEPGGVAQPSAPSSKELHANTTYWWLARYFGGGGNSANRSECGGETMKFGNPAALPTATITTELSGGGQQGTHITVHEGTPVTDTATITAPPGRSVSGALTYTAYAGESCSARQIPVLGGGLTTGTGPSTNALVLEAGTYYFQAYYSGTPSLKGASTPCGDEVLTVVGSPSPLPRSGGQPPPPPSPKSQFNFLGGMRVNDRNGQIVVTGRFPTGGTATSTAVVMQGATLARLSQAPAELAREKKCKRGFVVRHKKCTSNARVLYGVALITFSTAGTYTMVIKPTQLVLRALRAGRRLNVTVSTTFQNRAGGAPNTHVESVFVKLKRPGHRKR